MIVSKKARRRRPLKIIPSQSEEYLLTNSARQFILAKFELEGANPYGDRQAQEAWSLLRMLNYFLHKRMSSSVLFGDNEDSKLDYSSVLIDTETLRQVVIPGSRSDFSGTDYLNLFGRCICPIEYSEPRKDLLMARVLTDMHLPKVVSDQLRISLVNDGKEALIGLVSGEDYARPTRHRIESPVPQIRGIVDYLHCRPDELYAPITARLPEARAEIEAQRTWKVRGKNRCHRTLQMIEEYGPKPIYTAVERTTRVYAQGLSWLGLKREIRDVVTQDLTCMDLSAAQLRIASALWGFDLDPYLRSGSFWKFMLNDLDLRADNIRAKDFLKDFFYSAIFGRTLHELRKAITESGIPQIQRKLESHPFLKVLLEIRTAVHASMKAGAEFTDAWGQILRSDGTSTHTRSRMAALCQSYELRLLLPIFDFAQEHEAEGLHVIALNHDGLYATGRWAPYLETLSALVLENSVAILGVKCPIEISVPHGDALQNLEKLVSAR